MVIVHVEAVVEDASLYAVVLTICKETVREVDATPLDGKRTSYRINSEPVVEFCEYGFEHGYANPLI